MKNSILFSPVKIGSITIPNRFMRSATYEGLAGMTGLPRHVLNQKIENLSIGKCGLIVPGMVYPTPRGKYESKQCGMSRIADAQVWQPTVDTVHQNGSKIIFQVCHGGARCPPEVIGGQQPIGCSPIIPGSREMTESEIEETIDSFLQSSFRIQSMGADGIQLHCAHGYLFSAFLSPALNHRTDKWGGSIENRLRIVMETVKAIREFTSPDFIVSIKINGYDHIKGGVIPELTAEYIKRLHPFVDLFEISGGLGGKPSFGVRCKYDDQACQKNLSSKEYDQIASEIKKSSNLTGYNEGYNLEAAEIIHKIVPDANLALVGGLRSIPMMEKLLQDGTVKLISMSRPFLKQPHLVKDLESGKIKEIGCNSCGICTHYPEPERVGFRCHNLK
ncbi:oxidoreductase, FAD/FMN-binding family protein [Tritrichomonas foetus]|uniref:Oxidoreductase, FAD/FMN-binding family protein n=1 Tax=Tritrichomonas foetus TaxID=1144522 RepID=A0A1J4L3B8_9EUKA|nr:oxidoreductase, FAD/FMN-binding family protein [Tritrichomonas foetus]|eukprot:OHT16468.1 oxidoreductase, FAD/FMN-binding family protein [Tritrichomonas foetus]